ncbi:hypothetical protein [Bifidobacterium pseudocatenulatum]|uniref:hypothetical protein n=1 Tax=Bifidobacterium pseudocatenulatum TaxID=28026 RepID=UPI001F0FA99C|nr:hypothetical protein [Bifidobacterium pseudocatenulatum]MCH4858571.1 hypothetical protein [Bifidobacterium pseudocatenulatum]
MAWGQEYIRESICMVRYNHDGTVNNYLRLADYDSQASDIPFLWLDPGRWIDKNDPDDPATLYSMSITSNSERFSSDFVRLRWRPNPSKPDRPPVIDPFDFHNSSYDTNPRGLIEVVYLTDNNAALSEMLSVGFEYQGRPAERILLVYKRHKKNMLEATMLQSNKFEFQNGRAKLRKYMHDGKVTAPCFIINEDDVLVLPRQFGEKTARMLYSKAALPDSKGTIPIRPFEDYADDYLKWYCDQSSFNYSKDERQRIAALFKETINSPTTLEAYAGKPLDERDEKLYSHAVQRLIHADDDLMNRIIIHVLAADESFHRKCLDVVLTSKDQEIEERNKTLQQIENRIREKNIMLSSLKQREADDEAKHAKSVEELSQLDQQIKMTRRNEDEVLKELENNVALKIGLRSVVRNTQAATDSPIDSIPLPCPLSGASKKAEPGVEAGGTLIDNLEDSGIYAIGETSTEKLSDGLLATMAATRFLVVDSSFCCSIANSLSFMISGKPAYHVAVPIDWTNADAVLEKANQVDCTVLVIDNIIDTMNEGLLFSLVRSGTDKTIVFPIGARGNLKLLAPELWERIFYVPTDGFMQDPSDEMLAQYKAKDLSDIEQVGFKPKNKESLDENLQDTLPNNALVLPCKILEAFRRNSAKTDEQQKRKGMSDFQQWTIDHLLILVYAFAGPREMMIFAKNIDETNRAERLLRRIDKDAANEA